ncbi:MAG: four helix bundle protein [Muribaculaceae bacterium]|nr:four helix bundle protein [Muribaculaceae bacterium]
MDKNVFSFERLEAYQEARKLVVEVYRLINKLPRSENFALSDQLRRSVVSVPSNIAEGCGRRSYKEKIHFLEIAYGSLLEAYCQLEISRDLGYCTDTDLQLLKPRFFSISRLLSALSKSYTNKLLNPKHINP